LTEPFTLDTLYANAKIAEPAAASASASASASSAVKWRTYFTLRIPELFVSVTHAQYVMLLSALDSQMTDLRTVNETRAKAQQSAPPVATTLEELLTYRFHTEIDRCSIAFSHTGVPFARLDMKALHYITEDWTSKYKMYLGGDDVRLLDLTSTADASHFKSILHNRLGTCPAHLALPL
jgi:hypothetical protein